MTKKKSTKTAASKRLPSRCYKCDYSAGAVTGGVLTLYKKDEWCDGSPEMWLCPRCEIGLEDGQWEPKLEAEAS